MLKDLIKELRLETEKEPAGKVVITGAVYLDEKQNSRITAFVQGDKDEVAALFLFLIDKVGLLDLFKNNITEILELYEDFWKERNKPKS